MDVNTFLSFLSFLKDSKFIFGLFLFCLILILLPDSFLITLGLQKTVNQYRGYLGLACILTFIFGIFAIYPLIQKCINSRRKRKKILKRIDSLSREEQEILNECIKKNQQTIVRPAADSAAISLVEKGILLPAHTGHIMAQSFIIRDFVWEHLKSLKGLKL